MAVAETRALGLQLRAWRWLLLFVLAAQLLRLLVPAFLAISDPVDLLEERAAWAAGPGAQLRLTDRSLELRDVDRQGRGSTFASRTVPVEDDAQMLRVRICLDPGFVATSEVGRDVALLLASLRGGVLDFNRSYELRLLDGEDGNRCTSERFTRRRGDEQALLQLQLGPLFTDYAAGVSQEGPTALRELAVAVLDVTSLRESRTWRWLRRFMLILGIALVALLFYRYVPSRDRLFSVSGLLGATGGLTVAAIVFGCVVSVPLKAYIYELMTGGQVLAPTGAAVDELLVSAFPLGGFSIFTLLHGVLFAVAGTALGLADRRALPDLLLLGVVTETLQLYVPGRGPGLDDLLVDWAGVAVAAALVFLLRRPERVRLLLQE
jgi:hypothetical protein